MPPKYEFLLPDPPILGLPEKFSKWREYQDKFILDILDTEKSRFSVQCVPTGGGKSLGVVATAILLGKRVLFLTESKALMDQYLQDFQFLTDIRGKNNYPCKALLPGGEFHFGWMSGHMSCDEGPCQSGASCSLMDGGCDYFDKIREVCRSQWVMTNYHMWISLNRYSKESNPIGKFDMIVLDEAHSVLRILCSCLSSELDLEEIEKLDITSKFPKNPEVISEWVQWAKEIERKIEHTLELNSGKTSKNALIHAMRLKKIQRTLLQIVSSVTEDWGVSYSSQLVRFEPIWPNRAMAEKFLFSGIPSVVLTSATIRPQTIEMLGVGPEEYRFREYPSTFPLKNRPIIYIPTVQMRHGMTEASKRTWMQRIDQILVKKSDQKGILHTVSYSRQKEIVHASRYRDRILTHTSNTTRDAVMTFKKSNGNLVLASPSVSTGWDFPGDECRFQVITKLPFLDTRDPITKARNKAHPDHQNYEIMQNVVQMAGRGVRSEKDWCQTLIIDDQFRWFFRQYRGYAPGYFVEAVQVTDLIP